MKQKKRGLCGRFPEGGEHLAKKREFRFPSSDGKTVIYGTEWVPEEGRCRAVLQITHGMIEYRDRYRETASFLADRGFAVAVCDQLGHGDSVISADMRGYFSDEPGCICLIRDMHQVRKQMEGRYPGLPCFMLGHSMGSFLTRCYMTKYGRGLSGVILAGTGGIPSWIAGAGLVLLRLMAAGQGWHAYSPLAEKTVFSGKYKKYDLSGKHPEDSWLTRDTALAKDYYGDPRSQFGFSLNGFYGLVDAVYYANDRLLMKQIPETLPVLLLSGGEDPLGDFGRGTEKAAGWYRKAGIKNIECRIYPGARHEVLNEINRKQVYEDILGWCEQQIGPEKTKEKLEEAGE